MSRIKTIARGRSTRRNVFLRLPFEIAFFVAVLLDLAFEDMSVF
jgi:hypothetical protein